MAYKLLDAFRGLFDGVRYNHRIFNQGDFVSYHLYEDLYDLGTSQLLVERIAAQQRVLCVGNKQRGGEARRGDGTFGHPVPGVKIRKKAGFMVARADVATVEIGVEAKILAKAMIQQIGRVITDLVDQVDQFKMDLNDPICVGLVGINQADVCTSYEGEATCPKCGHVFVREYKTNGVDAPHPIQEAVTTEARLIAKAKPAFGEFLILRYRATNVEPYRFEWVDERKTTLDYAAALVRIASAYDRRFGGGVLSSPGGRPT